MDVNRTKLKFGIVYFMILFAFLFHCVYSQEQWNLQRISADESRVIFKNTTVTGNLMLCSWIWKDSLGGIWDTRVKLSFKNDSYKGGGFDYQDIYGRKLLSVRWYQSAYQNLKWKSIFSSKFPPTPWNISGYYINWGYSPASEYSWNFFIDNYTVEPKSFEHTNKIVNPYIIPMEEIAIAIRKKRATNSRTEMPSTPNDVRGFSIIDLFTGDGIFSQVPQMVINLFGFFSNLFPSGSNEYELPPDDYSTEPEAEVITQTTTYVSSPAPSKPSSKLAYVTNPMKLYKY